MAATCRAPIRSPRSGTASRATQTSRVLCTKEASTDDAMARPWKKSTKAIAPPNTPTTARPAHCPGRDGRVSTAL